MDDQSRLGGDAVAKKGCHRQSLLRFGGLHHAVVGGVRGGEDVRRAVFDVVGFGVQSQGGHGAMSNSVLCGDQAGEDEEEFDGPYGGGVCGDGDEVDLAGGCGREPGEFLLRSLLFSPSLSWFFPECHRLC